MANNLSTAVPIPVSCPSSGNCSPTIQGFEALFRNIVIPLLGFGGIVLLIMLLLAGFKYLTSEGDPKKVEGAQKTITYAIGGFVALTLAFLVIKTIEIVTGAPLTTFKVFQP
ncbi:hypothetical protein HY045_01255 [Candidatus Woesebacteria bacterium]|nr:hypothetical protein [Candidatus Woesebacteria bacterium]